MRILKITDSKPGPSIPYSFEAAKHEIGGFIAVTKTRKGETMLVDEDGGPKRLPTNAHATMLAGRIILGTAIILEKGERV